MVNEQRRKIQMEALKALEDNNYNGIVILPTGTGKSYILAECLKKLYKPGMSVLYTCDSIRLRDTDFNLELLKWGAGDIAEQMEMECYATTYKWEGKHFNILLADEGDYALTPEYCKLFANNTFDHIIFVSATLEDKKRVLARQIVAPIVYERKIKEIERQEVINKTQFYYVPYMLNKDENQKYLDYNTKFHNLLVQESTSNRDERLRFLTFDRLHFLASLQSSAYICRRLMNELTTSHSRILVFSGQTEQADRISKFSYHTKNASEGWLDKFHTGLINEIVVCGKIDRGVNIDGVNAVIMENVTRSETKMIQKLGRGKRLGVDEWLHAYMLVPYFRKTWSSQCKPQPTIILRKIQDACKNMGIENAKTYILKPGGTNAES